MLTLSTNVFAENESAPPEIPSGMRGEPPSGEAPDGMGERPTGDFPGGMGGSGGGDGYANLTLSEDSKWVVTADSTLDALSGTGAIVDADGNAVSVVGTNGTQYRSGSSGVTVTVSAYNTEADLSGAESVADWDDYALARPQTLNYAVEEPALGDEAPTALSDGNTRAWIVIAVAAVVILTTIVVIVKKRKGKVA